MQPGATIPDATTGSDKSFFDLPESALRFVSDLNLLGTMIPSQVFGKLMAQQKGGSDFEYFVDERIPPADPNSRLLRSKSCSVEFYAMAGGTHGAGILG